MKTYTESEEWIAIGGYIFGEKMLVTIETGSILTTITIPKLGIYAKGFNSRDAYWKLLYEFERALKEEKEFDDILWKRLRAINKVGGNLH
jgi:hypothetical protein